MGSEALTELLKTVRDSISRVEASSAKVLDRRVLTRALAHLWSAHDELELLESVQRPANADRPA